MNFSSLSAEQLTMTGLLRRLIALGMAIASTPLMAAPPTVDHLYPAGGQRGTTVSVRITGKLDGKTNVWCSCETAKLTLDVKSKTLKMVVPPDAKPGLYWVRLFNDEGSAPPKAFLIGTLPEIAEKEPNDRIEESQRLLSSQHIINGVLSKREDVDLYAVPLKKGEIVVASMTANNTLGSPMDGVLQVVSPRGFVLEQNDDDRGFDPQLTYTAREDGLHHVRVFAFPATPDSTVRLAGAANFLYRVTVTTGPFVDHLFPLAVNRSSPTPVEFRGWNLAGSMKPILVDGSVRLDSVAGPPPYTPSAAVRMVSHAAIREQEPNPPDKPQAVTLPVTLTGHIGTPRDTDTFQFSAKKGNTLRFQVEARSLGSPLDPVLRLLDAKGAVVAQAETRSSKDIDETLSYRVPTDGDYRLELSDLHRRGHWRAVYRLTMTSSPLLQSLHVAADQFTLNAGKPLVIPVTINGTAGDFAEAPQIVVRGLPAGVTTSVAAKGSKPKSKKSGSSKGAGIQMTLTTTSNVDFRGPIQIVAIETGGAPLAPPATAEVVGTSQRTSHLWLTITRTATQPAGKKGPKSK